MSDMVHLNGNKLCAIDCETTGLDSSIHEIIEIAIVVLDSFVKPTGELFHIFKIPERPSVIDDKALRVQHLKKVDIMTRGVDNFTAIEAFEDWFNTLGLRPLKTIVPIGHNYAFDRDFLRAWLGCNAYDTFFSSQYRDTMGVANYMNDRADFRSEQYPYPKRSLQYLCNQVQLENPAKHTALGDAVTTAEVYRRFLISGPLTL